MPNKTGENKAGKIVPEVGNYLREIESGQYRVCREQTALARYVRKCFASENIYTDEQQLANYNKLWKYFPFQPYPWELFLTALWDCTYWSDTGLPRWKSVFCMVGRGAGKDGYLSYNAMCSVSPYCKTPRYDVDICANLEEQAIRPLEDLVDVLETPGQRDKLDRHFYHTKQKVQGRRNRGSVRGRTNNPKSRDGMRTGKAIFNEVHQYQSYSNIKVFITGQGKVAHPRVGYFTSNGEISDGPLDDLLAQGRRILLEQEPDHGLLPFICALENKSQVHDPLNWYMANPSLQFNPSLYQETDDEYHDWLAHPERNPDFLTKRMGLRVQAEEIAVTDYENILATKQEHPSGYGWDALHGLPCVAGLDYAELSDWAAVNLHFRSGNLRFDINHAWVCAQSKTLSRVKAPWRDWAERGLLTVVDDVSIHPDLLAGYIQRAAGKYIILGLAMDNFRWTAVSESMKQIGFDPRDKSRLKLVRPSDIMQVEPVIQDCFTRQLFRWGDNPVLRWSVNNTKRVRSSRASGSDTGNFYFAKIEAKSRKNDPFMALVHSMILEPVLNPVTPPSELPPVIVIR